MTCECVPRHCEHTIFWYNCILIYDFDFLIYRERIDSLSPWWHSNNDVTCVLIIVSAQYLHHHGMYVCIACMYGMYVWAILYLVASRREGVKLVCMYDIMSLTHSPRSHTQQTANTATTITSSCHHRVSHHHAIVSSPSLLPRPIRSSLPP